MTALSLDARTNEARWAALPPLEGINRVTRLKTGATRLLLHPTARTEAGEPAPVLAVADAGKGRTLALTTDTSWHWGFLAAGGGDDGRTFQRFWEGAIRWLVRDPALTLLRIELDRVEYRRGQPASARVRTLHADYTPAENVRGLVASGPDWQQRHSGTTSSPRPTARRPKSSSDPCAPSRRCPTRTVRPTSSSKGCPRGHSG